MANGRKTGALHPDSGVTLVEVVVAVVVFMLLAAGVSAGAVTVIRYTADSRSREIATNLAAQELDAVRLVADPFALHAATTVKTISGRNYMIARSTSWVSAAGGDVACSTSTTLKYRRVNVTVSWNGQLPGTSDVRSDTLFAPNGPIDSATTGSVGVAMIGADGSGEAGVSVTLVATGGGAVTPSSQPSNTDENGCSFATGIRPGTYTITASRSGSIDDSQVAAPIKSITVVAGSTTPVSYTYDNAGTFPISYDSNYDGTALLPMDLTTTFLSSLSPYIPSGSSTSLPLFPINAGYRAIAGSPVTTTGATICRSVDPGAWPASIMTTPALAAGLPSDPVAASAGQTALRPLGVSMGVVQVKASGAGTLTATSTNSSSATPGGNPGCSTNRSYNFGSVLKNGTVVVALPFGQWTLSGSVKFTINTLTNATNTSTSTSATSVSVLLDPRAKK